MEADIALVIYFAAAFLLGVLRGALRQLIAIGAFLVSFVLAAYLRGPVGDWLGAQASQYSRGHIEMLGFLLAFVVLFGLAVVVIEVGGRTIQLSKRAAVDEVLGGFLALGAAVLSIGALLIIFDTYYAASPPPGEAEVGFVRDLYLAFERSAIARSLHGSLVPGLVALLGPLLPAELRALYA